MSIVHQEQGFAKLSQICSIDDKRAARNSSIEAAKDVGGSIFECCQLLLRFIHIGNASDVSKVLYNIHSAES